MFHKTHRAVTTRLVEVPYTMSCDRAVLWKKGLWHYKKEKKERYSFFWCFSWKNSSPYFPPRALIHCLALSYFRFRCSRYLSMSEFQGTFTKVFYNLTDVPIFIFCSRWVKYIQIPVSWRVCGTVCCSQCPGSEKFWNVSGSWVGYQDHPVRDHFLFYYY